MLVVALVLATVSGTPAATAGRSPVGGSWDRARALAADVAEGISVYDVYGFKPDSGVGATVAAASPSWWALAMYEGIAFGPVDPTPYSQSPLVPRTFQSTKELFGIETEAPTVMWAANWGRFIVAAATYDVATCRSGSLMIAMSKTTDPRGGWSRQRIAIQDARAASVTLQATDDKLILITDDFDLDPRAEGCWSTTWEGSRIRVVDRGDLIDGGGLTARDLTPVPRTTHRWLPAMLTPTGSSVSIGATGRLVESRRVDGVWDHLGYATVTGSARAGSARLTGSIDLTALGVVDPLVGPPAVLEATDGRPVSAAWRDGRLWLSSHTTCTPDGDTEARACARFLILDTTTSTPTLVEDAIRGSAGMETARPVVGVARDGTAYFVMDRSPDLATTPRRSIATYRRLGEPIVGGQADQVVAIPEAPMDVHGEFGSEYAVGSLVPDAADPAAVWLGTKESIWYDPVTGCCETEVQARAYRLQGGVSGAPSGDGAIRHAARSAQLTLAPSSTSPVVGLRVSFLPDTAQTPDGPRLVAGRDLPFVQRATIAPELEDVGGPLSDGPQSIWVQWRTADGTLSDPVEFPFLLDRAPPVLMRPTSRFEVGRSVGRTVPIRTAWSATDAASGMARYQLQLWSYPPASGSRVQVPLPTPTTTSVVRSLPLDRAFKHVVTAIDVADNATSAQSVRVIPRVYQGASPAITYRSTWSTATGSPYLGGSTRFATRAGAGATFTFAGRAAAIVATQGPSRGAFEVWVDGAKAATVDTRAGSTRYRQVVWQITWPTSGQHSIAIRVLGTPSRPRVDLDGFLKF